MVFNWSAHMNRYPLWKNLLVVIALVFGFLYTIPNFFGEAPAVQVTSVKATIKVDNALLRAVEAALQAAAIKPVALALDGASIRVRLADTDTQLKAKDAIEKALNPDRENASYSVALNLISNSPSWLTGIHALPMYLGLDLRGGVHFLLQVDMKGALAKRLDSLSADLRSVLREKNIRHNGIERDKQGITISFRDAAMRESARRILADTQPDLALTEVQVGDAFNLVARLKPEAEKQVQDYALKQNIVTLHNRINELGVAEPIIQQQGADRVVVQLPGVQDTAKAKDILGRTATLEVRMVDDEASNNPGIMAQAARGQPPFGTEYYVERGGRPLLVKKQVVLTGERLTDAQPGFDGETHGAAVHLTLDAAGSRIFRDITRESIGKRMAILLIEKGKGEVVTAPVIRSEISGGRVQISGSMTTSEAADVALLLRAGSLAAPMEIIEERTIGPSLGAENISKGFHSTLWGFTAIAVFMMAYYLIFGVVSVLALSANLLLLIALLSLLQATLTLPGIAAIALALGMAIDSNVLINERIREELRNGSTPQAAIMAGYDRAWATIVDSNVTTLIAGIALLVFGSGAVRGFAVVHCLGILTSIFSSVVVSRALVNLIYGHRRKLESLSIGQVWTPAGNAASGQQKAKKTLVKVNEQS
nr:protein translocase subunit SecD [uncultured bacterium]QLG20619.1 protein translocase subunit SecD [uncultured bacterium]